MILTGNERPDEIDRVGSLNSMPLRYGFEFASYVAKTEDLNKWIFMDSASATTFTINADSTFDVILAPDRGPLSLTGFIVTRWGAGTMTFVAGAGVTIRSAGGSLAIPLQYGTVTCLRVKRNEYLLSI